MSNQKKVPRNLFTILSSFASQNKGEITLAQYNQILNEISLSQPTSDGLKLVYQTDPDDLGHDFEFLNYFVIKNNSDLGNFFSSISLNEQVQLKLELFKKIIDITPKIVLNKFAFYLVIEHNKYNSTNKQEQLAFAKAVMDYLCKKIDINQQNQQGNTLLHYEYMRKIPLFMDVLIKNKINPHILNNNKISALFYCISNHAFSDEREKVILKAIDFSGISNGKDNHGLSFVDHLCQKNFPLKKINAYLNPENLTLLDKSGNNAYFYLLRNQKKIITIENNFDFLRENQVDYKLLNQHGRNFITQGIIDQHNATISFLSYYQSMHGFDLWEELGFDLTQLDLIGNTIAHYIAQKITEFNIPEPIQKIMALTFNIPNHGKNQLLPIDLAIDRKNYHMVDYLAKLHNFPDLSKKDMPEKIKIIRSLREKEDFLKIVDAKEKRPLLKL